MGEVEEIGAPKSKAKRPKARALTDSDGEPAAEWVERTRLVPWGNNPRVNDEAAKEVAKAIKRLGFGAPIVARSADNMVIAGHTRLKAAEMLGLDRVPVRFVDLDPADARLMAIADNKLGEKADWNIPKLGDVLSEFSFDDAEIAGFGKRELDKLAGEAGASADPGALCDVLSDGYQVVIDCEDEAQQTDLLNELMKRGLTVKALML